MLNSRDLKDLKPYVRELCEKLMAECKKQGFEIGVSSTMRDAEYQDTLYAQGRTKKGQIVTRLDGDHIGAHGFGLAFDIYVNKGGSLYDSKLMRKAGKIGMKLGLDWGGSWKDFCDTPHFQYLGGLSNADLRAGKMPKFPEKKKVEKKQRDLKVKCVGEDVKDLQRELNKHGAHLVVDGDFQGETKDAVVAFQKKHKLKQDGIVGESTYKLLFG